MVEWSWRNGRLYYRYWQAPYDCFSEWHPMGRDGLNRQWRILGWVFVVWCVVFLSAAILEYSIRG